MLKLKGKVIQLLSNDIVPVSQFEHFKNSQHLNDYLRLQCYLNQSKVGQKALTQTLNPIQEEQNSEDLKQEINRLPEKNTLVNYRHFSAYYAQYEQIPYTLKEITRLREITFREQNEGSGLECDKDDFDKTYTHLFVFDHQAEKIVGAYRMGRTDILLKQDELSSLYLSQTFEFKKDAFNLQAPSLELGRSFISPAYQNSFYALLLLWKGICAFAYSHPQYRTLYGTVSLSQKYQALSITLINKTLNQHTPSVQAHHNYKNLNSAEIEGYFKKYKLPLPLLSALVKGIEEDNKDIPILLKHYHKMGAEFHALGVDKQFNNTPGFLLSVDLAKAPEKLLNLYFGVEEKVSYQQYQSPTL
ncbi:GNAT family N-acetyltransferase [Psychromonas sp. KJ10-10]|uniref:GNAT family N-acetyltransferase n=1 Tax=Psychromonas sp. KJ10-10 TaxID=3391823 RepID=UPI0039B685D5